MKEGGKVASDSCVKIGQIRIGSYDFNGNMEYGSRILGWNFDLMATDGMKFWSDGILKNLNSRILGFSSGPVLSTSIAS